MNWQRMIQTPIYQNFGKRVALDPEHFSLGWIALKDVGLYKETAMQVESQAPLAHLLHNLLVVKK